MTLLKNSNHMKKNSSPSLAELLKRQTDRLKAAGISTARLDCLVIFEDTLSINRAEILARPDFRPSQPKIKQIELRVARRENNEPLAYIRGKAYFYGREFLVNHHTLVPRPETETMIDVIKKIPLPDDAKIADIGCGSGCIGITLALELEGCQIDLIDIDKQCLKMARLNSRVLGVKTHSYLQDLLNNNYSDYDLIAANLPYVPAEHIINESAMFEPKHAIFGGKDGLDLYRRLFDNTAKHNHPPSYIITESLPPQHQQLASIAKKYGYKLSLTMILFNFL